MKRPSLAGIQCSLARGLELMGDWWTPMIIRDIYLGVNRAEDIVENLGVSRNLLTRRLRELEANGMVARSAYQQKPLRFEYALTESGRDLVPIIVALTSWGDRWAGPPEGRPIVFTHETCGKAFDPLVCCSACGKPATTGNIVPKPGPGGRARRGTKLMARRLAIDP